MQKSLLIQQLIASTCLFRAGLSLSSSADPTIRVLYAGYSDRYAEYKTCLEEAFRELNLDVFLTNDLENPSNVDYIIYNPKGPLQDFSSYCNAKAVFNLQAGADAVANNPTLPPSVPLTRMVDPGLREGMVEYVVGHVLRYHLSTDQLWEQKRAGEWQPRGMPLARQKTVGILGLGELGSSCANALVGLNFQVFGWTRSTKQMDGIQCYSGPTGLISVLQASDVLVLLLPSTKETHHILNKDNLAQCKKGVHIINVGRGSSIKEDDLLEAMNDGTVSGATLDVFHTEPLPKEHPFWKHPRILVTPHMAAKSRSNTASKVVAENILRAESGRPLLYLVDRTAGY
eukprot:scaffold17318_cov169-Amphora_coffeaeformis.AAC.3